MSTFGVKFGAGAAGVVGTLIPPLSTTGAWR